MNDNSYVCCATFLGIYDGEVCGKICATELSDPNNGPAPACTLNDCLQCDEDLAGPLFSSIGGRTRRRSGLLSEVRTVWGIV